ncbi:MAG: hypothetical protein J6C96_06245 [Oscillospiraceae bacterium]|nr:hypothetical protein [Oscillospiraceae bacterium]
MQELLTSEETLRHDEPVELTELFVQRRKIVTLGDTLVVQTSICVAMAAAFVIANIVNSDAAADIFQVYETTSGSSTNLIKLLADFIVSRLGNV